MLNVILILDRDSYSLGESITAKVVLKNEGTSSQIVNGRLSLNSAVTPQPFREIAFAIFDPTGAEVGFALKVNRGFPEADDFKELRPGETIEDEYPIHKYYILNKPGKYTIQSIYQNQSDPGDGREAWKGELKSNVVSFTVEA